ncbi:BCL2/adenovirus E1B 19 kDa protein-interacting protein 3-like isoform 1-T1 [Guaruba guarouba]
MGARGRHVTGRAAVAERGGAMACTGDDGSWVELRCGPGGPEPEPLRLSSCHADVERMLLEAQLETESSDGALLLLGSPVWDEDGASPASKRLGDSDLRPPFSQPQPGCLHPRQRDMPDEAKRREHRLPASLNWACTCHPQHFSPKEFAFVCSPQPVLWSLQGGAVGRKKKLFSSELLLLFIPSLLLSHVLTLGLGIYIGKRLAASSANPL